MAKANAFILKATGEVNQHYQEHEPTLELLQKTVGGNIEILHVPLTTATAAGMLCHHEHTPEMAQLIINENGRLIGDLKVNVAASYIAGQEIVGTAILLTGEALCT